MKVKETVIYSSLKGGEYIVIDLEDSDDKAIKLVNVEAKLFDCIVREYSFSEIIDSILKDYEVERSVVEKDLSCFINGVKRITNSRLIDAVRLKVPD